jgi:IS30 family transposase
MTYKHLSQEERYQICILMTAGNTQQQIADLLGRHKSTISREIARNTGGRGYRPYQACLMATKRSLGSRNAVQITAEQWSQTVHYLHNKWSPEQVANRVGISHETIYRHIYADKAAGGSLWKELRCQKKRKKRYASGRERRGQIVGRRSISERPTHIEERTQVGHWEGDTVIGAHHKQAIVTLVERKSGYAILSKVTHKTAEMVGNAIISELKPFAPLVKTLTFDNGKEFAGHQRVDRELQSITYFADPFASWQRGSNENLNGLLRQYIPKKKSLFTVTQEQIKMIQDQLNNRPRKRLGFKTPNEVFMQSIKRVALRK